MCSVKYKIPTQISFFTFLSLLHRMMVMQKSDETEKADLIRVNETLLGGEI